MINLEKLKYFFEMELCRELKKKLCFINKNMLLRYWEFRIENYSAATNPVEINIKVEELNKK